jgi:hypothetical protein
MPLVIRKRNKACEKQNVVDEWWIQVSNQLYVQSEGN